MQEGHACQMPPRIVYSIRTQHFRAVIPISGGNCDEGSVRYRAEDRGPLRLYLNDQVPACAYDASFSSPAIDEALF